MATSSKQSEEKLDDLSAAVSNLEDGLNWEFAQCSQKHYANPGEYFLWTYSEAVHTLQLISEEKWGDNADPNIRADLDSLSTRTVELLSRSVEYVRMNGFSLSPVHKGLLQVLHRLSDWGGRSSYRLGTHIVNMTLQLQNIKPPSQLAWTQDGSDIKSDTDFERLFKEFSALEKDPRNFQREHELYVTKSYSLLEAACETLNLPADQPYPDAHFFDNESRPTYVEYSYGSREFAYGKGSRLGMLSVKSALGAVLTADEARGVDEERKKTKRKHKRRVANEPSRPKKARTNWGYTMTSADAAADIENVLRDNRFTNPRGRPMNRPDNDMLITPTVEARKVLLAQYRDDLRRISDDIYNRKFGEPTSTANLPQSSAERDAWLARATRELSSARAAIYQLINFANTPPKAKQLRLAAYKLKLIRSVYTIGLLAGEPPASREEVKDGLQERLSDWILHEEA